MLGRGVGYVVITVLVVISNFHFHSTMVDGGAKEGVEEEDRGMGGTRVLEYTCVHRERYYHYDRNRSDTFAAPSMPTLPRTSRLAYFYYTLQV